MQEGIPLGVLNVSHTTRTEHYSPQPPEISHRQVTGSPCEEGRQENGGIEQKPVSQGVWMGEKVIGERCLVEKEKGRSDGSLGQTFQH